MMLSVDSGLSPAVAVRRGLGAVPASNRLALAECAIWVAGRMPVCSPRQAERSSDPSRARRGPVPGFPQGAISALDGRSSPGKELGRNQRSSFRVARDGCWGRGRWGGGRRGRGRRERCWNHRRSRRRHRLPRSVQSSFGPVLDNLNARFDAVGERHIPPSKPTTRPESRSLRRALAERLYPPVRVVLHSFQPSDPLRDDLGSSRARVRIAGGLSRRHVSSALGARLLR